MQNSIPRIIAAPLATFCLAAIAAAQVNADRVGDAYIPPDAVATAVLTVGDTMAIAAAEMYPTEIADAWCKQNLGFMARDIKDIKLVIGAPGPSGPIAGVVVTLSADFNLEQVNSDLVDKEQALEFDGYKAYAVRGMPDLVMHAKDPRTVLLASKNYLASMLRAAEGGTDGVLAALAATTPHNGTLTAIVSIESVRPMINGLVQMQSQQIPGPFLEFTQIPNLIDAVFMRIDLQKQEEGVKLVMLAGDEAKADQCLGTMVKGMQLAQQMFLAQSSQDLAPDDPVAQATARYMQRLSNRYVEMMTPKKEGRRLTITANPTQSMATQGVLIGLLLPAVQAARQASRRMTSSNNMKQIGLAIHNYHSAYRRIPGNITSEDGTPLLSWRVAILPFMEELDLYNEFKLDEPWDSPHNIKLLDKMPAALLHPEMTTEPSTTVYQRPAGEGMFSPNEDLKFRNILDGLSNTIMAVESLGPDAVKWTKPEDIQPDQQSPISTLDDGIRPGFHVLMADGAVIFITKEIDPVLFNGLLTRAGAEVLEF